MNMNRWPTKVIAVIALLVALGMVVMSSGVLSLVGAPVPDFESTITELVSRS